MSRGGPAYLRSGQSERRRKRVRRRSSGPHECGSGRRRWQSGPAPESGDWIGVWFSESGIESLVRSGGWRRLRRFAGSTGASNVAFRGITPDAGQVGGLAQSRNTSFGSRNLRVRDGSRDRRLRASGLTRGYQTGTCVPAGWISRGRRRSPNACDYGRFATQWCPPVRPGDASHPGGRRFESG